MSSESEFLEAYLDVEERESLKKNEVEWRPDTLKRLAQEILKDRRFLIPGLALMLVVATTTVLGPKVFAYAIDHVIISKEKEKLLQVTLLFVAVESLRVIALISQGYLFELLGQNVMHRLRTQLFGHLLRLPLVRYDQNPVGRLVTRVTNDVGSVSEMFSSGFISMFGNLLTIVALLIAMLLVHFKLGLITASVFPLMLIFAWIFSQKLRVAYRNARSKLSALNAFLAENILGMRIVHLFRKQRAHLNRYHEVNEWYSQAQIGTIRVFAYFQPTITWLSGLSMVLAMYFGGNWVKSGEVPVGTLFIIFSYSVALFQPIRELADKWNLFLSGMASADRVFSMLDWVPERGVEQIAHRTDKFGTRGKIEFRNVSFAYPSAPDCLVLKNFSVVIESGMKVGIVGHTGAGKSTFVQLLLRFYEITSGTILIDDRDINTLSLHELRTCFGMIQQDVFLFSGSIDENIRLFDGSVETATALLKIKEDEKLKPLYENLRAMDSTQLIERGTNLSMGERQLMSFFRAVLRNPSIWILDEATANMDSLTELILDEALVSVAQEKTRLLIAHRLATVKDADLILVLHHGQLMESGNHSELLAKQGIYSHLYQVQDEPGKLSSQSV